jgi:hypothetical protein
MVSVNHTVGSELVYLEADINIFSLPQLTDQSPECDGGQCMGVTGQSLEMTYTFDFIPSSYLTDCSDTATQCEPAAAAVSFGGIAATGGIRSVARDMFSRTVIRVVAPTFDTTGDLEVRST